MIQPYVETPGVEQWRPVVGWESKYEISDWGRLRGMSRQTTDHLGRTKTFGVTYYKMKQNANGYLSVNLYHNKKHTTYQIHRMVALAFLPNPDNLPLVEHIKDIKTDNRASQLRWSTYKQNTQSAITNGKIGKLGLESAKQMRIDYITESHSYLTLAKKYNVSKSLAERIIINLAYYDQNYVPPPPKQQSILTAALATEIRTRLANKERSCDLCDVYHISSGAMSAVKTNKSYYDPLWCPDILSFVVELKS